MRPLEPDHVHVVFLRGVEDRLRRDHHAEVDDLVAVAAEDDADDVLADVVHVALDGRHEDLLARDGFAGLLGLDERREVGHGALHHAGALDDLGEEHLPAAEEIADAVHAGHERPLDHVQRLRQPLASLLGVGLDIIRDALDERVREPLFHGSRTPRLVLLARHARGSAKGLGVF